ncbi:MAG: peptidase [Xanthobacteraceae bacterium]|nr:peptidase [Xanthobacteraceae bacterium]
MDPRLTPARADLAAKHLEGQVTAARFVEGVLQEVMDPQAPVRREPRPDGALDTEALLGERVTVYETTDEGWSWGQLHSDGYVGWLPAFALARPRAEPTHRVSALRTLAFPGPSIKIPPVQSPPLGARIAIARQQDRFAVTPNGHYLPAQHLVPLCVYEDDFLAVAERFLGAPYLWGGKTSLGLDCSGLVQVALTACGVACPRDSDMQERALGISLDKDSTLQRGDLIFWKGHVAIARDEVSMIHANAFHMAVAIEPIVEAVERIAAGGSRVTSVKRFA